MRVLKEMRNMLLENGGRGILVRRWQKVELDHVLHFYGEQSLDSDELGYLNKEIS